MKKLWTSYNLVCERSFEKKEDSGGFWKKFFGEQTSEKEEEGRILFLL
jgi:hypothetical protein